MNSMPASHGCPLDLDYPEPDPVWLDVSVIKRRGRTIRRRQRTTAFGSALTACVAVASVLAGLHGTAPQRPPRASASAIRLTGTPIDALVADNPPVTGMLTLLSDHPAHWTTVAWATQADLVCWATYRTPARRATTQSRCWYTRFVPGPGRPALSPLLQAAFPPAPGGGTVAEYGLVTPSAARVTLTALGRRFSAGVVAVPRSHGKLIGIYLIWLPAARSGNISEVVAYDDAGRLVARRKPGK